MVGGPGGKAWAKALLKLNFGGPNPVKILTSATLKISDKKPFGF